MQSMTASPASALLSFDSTRAQTEFRHQCVEFFAEVLRFFGVPKSVGQIYGLLYASPFPLRFSEIVGLLAISKGSVSQGLQLLRSLGAINIAKPVSDKSRIYKFAPQIAMRAPRNIAYEPEVSLRKWIGGVLQEHLDSLDKLGADSVTRLHNLAEQIGEGNDFYLDRANRLNAWRKQLKTLRPVLRALLGPKKN